MRYPCILTLTVAHSLAPSNNQLQGLRAAIVGGGASGCYSRIDCWMRLHG